MIYVEVANNNSPWLFGPISRAIPLWVMTNLNLSASVTFPAAIGPTHFAAEPEMATDGNGYN